MTTTTIFPATVSRSGSGSGEVILSPTTTIANFVAAIKTAFASAIPTATGCPFTVSLYDSGTDGSSVNYAVYQITNKTTSTSVYLIIKFPLYSGSQYQISQQLSLTWNKTTKAVTGTPGNSFTPSVYIDLTKTININYISHQEMVSVYIEQSGLRAILGFFYPLNPNTWNQAQSLPVFIPYDVNLLTLQACDPAYTAYPSASSYTFLGTWPLMTQPNPNNQTPDTIGTLPIFPNTGQGIVATFSTDLIVVAAAGSTIRNNTFTETGALTGTYTMILSNASQPSLAIATA
jgi:hypothetical protein